MIRRRTFAAPLVLTLASGCPKKPPDHTLTNPPEPKPTPTKTASTQWYVQVGPNNACSATPNTPCPEPEPGQPRMTCNPPMPADYKCPDGVTANFTIDQFGDECTIKNEMTCDPGEKCNPPAPRKVDCPKY